MNRVKVIAQTRIHKTEAGGELEVSSTEARALVALGKVRYAATDAEAAAPAEKPRARARTPRAPATPGPIGVSTRADAVGIAPDQPSEPTE